MQIDLPQKQKGAAAIEFALVFTIFFAVLYGVLSYSLPLLLMQSFNHATAEAVRRSVAVDPNSFEDDDAYKDKLESVVKEVVAERLAWMPKDLRDEIASPYMEYDGVILTVTLSLPSAKLRAIMPVLELPGITVPNLPTNLEAVSSIQF